MAIVMDSSLRQKTSKLTILVRHVAGVKLSGHWHRDWIDVAQHLFLSVYHVCPSSDVVSSSKLVGYVWKYFSMAFLPTDQSDLIVSLRQEAPKSK